MMKVFERNKSVERSKTVLNLSVRNPESWPTFTGSKVRQPITIYSGDYAFTVMVSGSKRSRKAT